jgi:hypothetical protein
MNRRGFLRSLTGLVAAPAVVRSSSLMPVVMVSKTNLIVPPDKGIIIFSHYGIERMRIDGKGKVWISANAV